MRTILKTYIEEDHPCDVYLAPNSQVLRASARSVAKGEAFQLKRLVSGSSGQSEEDLLIAYLTQKIPRKYAPLDANLVVLLVAEGGGSINLRYVRDNLKIDNYPFRRIMFVAPSEFIVIGELWPSWGMNHYTYDTFESIEGGS